MPVTLPSRAIFSIDPAVLSQFNALFASRERSKVVERLILAGWTPISRRCWTPSARLKAIRAAPALPRCLPIWMRWPVTPGE